MAFWNHVILFGKKPRVNIYHEEYKVPKKAKEYEQQPGGKYPKVQARKSNRHKFQAIEKNSDSSFEKSDENEKT